MSNCAGLVESHSRLCEVCSRELTRALRCEVQNHPQYYWDHSALCHGHV